jgi:hypothetical protein
MLPKEFKVEIRDAIEERNFFKQFVVVEDDSNCAEELDSPQNFPEFKYLFKIQHLPNKENKACRVT